MRSCHVEEGEDEAPDNYLAAAADMNLDMSAGSSSPVTSLLRRLSRTARSACAYSAVPQPLIAQQADVGSDELHFSTPPWRRVRYAGPAGLLLVATLLVSAWQGARHWASNPLPLRATRATHQQSPLFWQEAEVQAVGVVWVGCFTTDDSQKLVGGPAKYGFNTQTCSQACVGYTYMVLQDGGLCVCGDGYAEDPRQQQVFDGSCGAVCGGEDELSPTRYCGTGDKNAVYRLREPGGGAGGEEDSELIGSWLFGNERSECFISKTEDNNLRFGVPLPQGQTAFGVLQPLAEGWRQADLSSGDGERVGTIRLRLIQPEGTLISNFKYPGETTWGKDTLAHKTTQEGVSPSDAGPADSSDSPIRSWQVVTQHGLNVRSVRDKSSTKLATKWEGSIVRGRREGVWLHLVDEPGFMLIADGGKAFLRRVPGSADSAAKQVGALDEDSSKEKKEKEKEKKAEEATTTTVPTTATSTSTTTGLTTTTTPEVDPVVRAWVVVTSNGLFVRNDKDRAALVLGTKVPGSVVHGRRTGNWVHLVDEPGYMMVAGGDKALLMQVSTTHTTTVAGELCTGDCSKKPEALSCLKWQEKGCGSIKDEDTCMNSLDGRKILSLHGRKVHGQPCVWCGGQPCSEKGPLCEPFDFAVGDAKWSKRRFKVASCKEEKKLGVIKPGIFCYALMMPTGYEGNLLRAQNGQAVGIFGCDGYVVFSNVSISLGNWNSTGHEVMTVAIEGSLTVAYGGKWYTALNTGVFLRVWKALVAHGGYAKQDWTVKADADCVFFPSRLRDALVTAPMSAVPMLQNDVGASCGNCKLQGSEDQTCVARVHALQGQGKSCEQALSDAARPWPQDCGCSCGASSCEEGDKAGAMFLINCRYGLHGPIEVLSRQAVKVFIEGIPQCEVLRSHPWGEDKYLDQCLQLLGVKRVLAYEMLEETACGKKTVHCSSSNVAFHPFKEIQSYFDCWGQAAAHGKWPGNALTKEWPPTIAEERKG